VNIEEYTNFKQAVRALMRDINRSLIRRELSIEEYNVLLTAVADMVEDVTKMYKETRVH
jgi:hypothetical protein